MPQASRTLLPNKNGHQTSPATSAQNSAHSVILLSVATPLILEVLVVGRLTWSREKGRAREEISRFMAELSGPQVDFLRRTQVEVRCHTSGESPPHPPTNPEFRAPHKMQRFIEAPPVSGYTKIRAYLRIGNWLRSRPEATLKWATRQKAAERA